MNKTWLLGILTISLFLLATLKTQDLRSLKTFYRSEKIVKIESFSQAKSKVKGRDLDHLKLWESMLTGRSAPLSRLMKERYQSLGLNHLFTPSGFHLSAAVFPFMKLLHSRFHLFVLLSLGSIFLFLPGLSALKRMLLIKTNQNVLGFKAGFVAGLLLDIFFGSFQSGALSFTYSFLFLGIIYSGLKGIGLVVWFFIAQLILAYFQNADISLLLLLFSPLLNLVFGLVMPLLLIFSIPLWDWQLHSGLYLINVLQKLVDFSSEVVFSFPLIEVNFVTLTLLFACLYRKTFTAIAIMIFFSGSLNLDRSTNPGPTSYEFVPSGKIVKTIFREKDVTVYFQDGRCRMKLVRGFWYENCSPKRRSSRYKKLKKLSYPS